MNYQDYHLSKKERLYGWIIALGITSVIAFLFYRSWWAMLLLPAMYPVIQRRLKVQLQKKRLGDLQEHFMQGIQVLNSGLQAGMSMENAWKEVEKECELLYGKQDAFYLEVRTMNRTVTYNQPIEQLFLDFSHRTGIADIISFAEIFGYGKRSGGNWKIILDRTVTQIAERYEAEREIAVMVAAKRLEQQVMNLVPLGMLLFLQVSSWEYVSVLYHNSLGVMCMSICLAVYLFAICLAEKIMEIRV